MFDAARVALGSKERAIFEFVIKINGNSHGVSEQEIAALRELGTTDSELVEAIEILNTGNSMNILCDALAIPSDPFLTYEADETL